MTFCFSLGNADQIIQASDRRLTGPKGELVDDSANKAGHALCDDASFLYTFTGLARVSNTHITSRWLLEALYDAAQNGHEYNQIIPNFSHEAASLFKSSVFLKNISPAARRITFMFTGYTADGFLVNSLVTNFQDFENFIDHAEALPEFTFTTWRSRQPAEANPTIVPAIGQFGALEPTDEKELRELLERRAPAEAIRQKVIALIQEISDRPKSRGAVGKRINTARLKYDNPTVPVAGYDSDIVENSIHLLDQVNLQTGAPKILISDVKLKAAQPVLFPKRHRNAPCSCGSGQKYRLCHGRRRIR